MCSKCDSDFYQQRDSAYDLFSDFKIKNFMEKYEMIGICFENMNW